MLFWRRVEGHADVNWLGGEETEPFQLSFNLHRQPVNLHGSTGNVYLPRWTPTSNWQSESKRRYSMDLGTQWYPGGKIGRFRCQGSYHCPCYWMWSLIRVTAVPSRQPQETPFQYNTPEPERCTVCGLFSVNARVRSRTRSNQSILAKLRYGHFTGLQGYKARIDNVSDPTCNLCGQAPRTLKHWPQECPATAQQRWDMFEAHSGNLDCLTRFLRKEIFLTRRTLLGEQRWHHSNYIL